MNAKEVKTRLKEAREAIRLKDFEGAATHCKAILEKEANNYNALVFLGVSCEGLDQIDQALNAYKKATSECPSQPLAWQGIGSLLEKHPSHLEIQGKIEVFEKLQSFSTGNEEKRVSHLHKLVRLYIESKDDDKAYKTLQELLELEKEGDGRVESCKAMIDLLNSERISVDDSKSNQYHRCINELLESHSLAGDDINKYTKLSLHSKFKISGDICQRNWEDLRCKFPKAVPPLEFGLQVYLEQTIGDVNAVKNAVEKVPDLCKDLEELSPENDMVKTGLGFMAWYQSNYSKAKDYLTGVSTSIVTAQYYLCHTYLKLHDLTSCLRICSMGLQNVTGPGSLLCISVEGLEVMLKLIQAEAHRQMGSEGDQETTLEILEQVEGRRPNDALIIKSYLYLDQDRLTEAQDCVQSLPQDESQVKILQSSIHMAQKQYSKALPILEDVLHEEPDHAAATLKKGVTLWNLKDTNEIENAKQQCFSVLLKAAKLDPYNYESFLYLGYFYEQVQKDINKASRCYRKSYGLNPSSNEAGCALVDCLSDQQEQSQAIDVLKDVTSKAPAGKAKWAWLRLGLYQMKHEDPSTAITSLQSALRADPKDNHVWECLSEAYLHRGSLTAALKAFTKASELNPESTYCLYQIANIKQTLGLLSEAVDDYRKVLEMQPTYVAALKGLGETMILVAKQNLYQCLDGLAQDKLEEALAILTRAASHRPDFSCVWKLMGDNCTLVSCLSSDSYRIPSKLLQKSSDSQSVTQVTKEEMLQVGGRCYSQAVKIMPENAALWHNLGVNLYRQSCHQHQRMHQEPAKELLQRARKALENSLKLDPQNWRHWNALGVLACSKVDPMLPFAQHCFIKSVECEASNVVAWSNLGVLYLSEGNIKLAHDALKAAQRLDPTYLVGWLGQALVAETVGHEEAMDLFRHTTELGAHMESQLGYGHQVLSMLRDETKQNTDLFNFCIHRMAAIPAASDALIKYTARVQTDPTAYNMLGLLLEHQNLIRPSMEAFERALKHLEGNDKKGMENQVRMNYARTLSTLGHYKESMEQFQKIGSDLSLEHLFLYALTAYKDGQYIDSFKLYKLALDQLPDDSSLKSQVFAALAMVAFKVNDLEEAKTQLFNSFQTAVPSLHGILTMCALGLYQGDMTLASAALEELGKRADTNTLIEKVAVLTLYKHVLEGSVVDGESWIEELIQANPENARQLRAVLAFFLINKFSHRGSDVLECIKTVQAMNETLNLAESVTKTLAQLQSGQHNGYDINRNSFKSAQRAFHQNPGDLSAVASMACAAHAEGVLRKSCGDQTTFFGMEKALLDMVVSLKTECNNSQFQMWYVQQLIMCCVELGDEGGAREMLGTLKEDGASEFVEALTLFLYATPIDEWSKKENMLSVQVVCALLAEESNDITVAETMRKIVEEPVGNQVNLPTQKMLELWTHTAFKELQMKKLKGSPEMDKLFDAGVAMFETKGIKSPVVSIMQGVRLFRSAKKLAKKHFATALDQSEGRSGSDMCKSVARQGLLSLLKDSTNDSDQQLVQALLNDAKSDADIATVELHEQLFRN